MNLTPYQYLRDGNDLEPMDERHVRMIHSVLVSESPTSVANIGVANGYSSIATLEAVAQGHVSLAFFVDIRLRECFKKLLPPNLDGHLLLCEQNSKDFGAKAECWIIDGCHAQGAIDDYENARKVDARIVIAHDTAPTWSPHSQWGAIKIGERMRSDAVVYFEDHKDRPGELTKRGLTIAFYYTPKEDTLRNLQALNV